MTCPASREHDVERTMACVASVSLGFGSKERPRNRIFGVFSTRKMGREPKNERGWWGRGTKEGKVKSKITDVFQEQLVDISGNPVR